MEQIVITIHPAPSDEGMLRVSDAMQQVIDLLRLHEAAQRAIASPEEAFDWRLVSATTNSPFTVVALAEPRNPATNIDIDPYVRRVNEELSSGMRNLIERNEPAWWMVRDVIKTAQDVFTRNQNGISETAIALGPSEPIAIRRIEATAGLQAIAGITAFAVEEEIPERRSWGEIQGAMVAAGRYRGKPAIQMRTEQYGFVWCWLPPALLDRFGGEHRLTEVWDGKAIGVEGDLIYARGGKLSRIEATDIRELEAAPPVDLASVLDPNFTSGLHPVEYLRRLWEGSLAS